MSTVVKPSTFSAGATIIASEHNNNFDTIYNDYNGNITNVNIASNATIVDTKLAQITTAAKVHGSSLTGLASINTATAGVIPTANLPAFSTYTDTRFYVGSFSIDMSTASGDQVITGVGFTSKAIIFLSSTTNMEHSMGFDNGITYGVVNQDYSGGTGQSDSYSIRAYTAAGPTQYTGLISAIGSNGFTITWTRTGTPTGTLYVKYLALR